MEKDFKENERLGEERLNNQGCLMKVVEYNNARDIIVEFQDKYKARVCCQWNNFINGIVSNPFWRVGEVRLNYQNDLMQIIKYNRSDDIIVEFQDLYKGKVHTTYRAFKMGKVKNPYHPTVCGVGMIGDKYPSKTNDNLLREYDAWKSMLNRCYNVKYKEKYPTYQSVTCCEEWLLYENFYEWLHSQENFDKWVNQERWSVDKDILVKGNKIYSPETCCLVSMDINQLFSRHKSDKKMLPIGVKKVGVVFQALCYCNGKENYIGTYKTIEEAFLAYKTYKEDLIKRVAQEEYDKGNITKRCYEAMLNYKVEITD